MHYLPYSYLAFYGIIRSYENKTCEIPLLSGQNLSIWQEKTPMFSLQTNMVNPSQKTRTSKRAYSSECFESNLFGEIHAQPTSSKAARGRAGEFSPQVPSGSATFYRKAKPSKISCRTSDFVGRRPLVPLPQQSLDTLSNRVKILFRKNSCIFRSHPPSGKRRRFQVETNFCGHPCRAASANPWNGRRQSQRHDNYRAARKMDSSTLSFSFNSQTPNPTRAEKTCSQRRSSSRRDLPIDSSSSRNQGRNTSEKFIRTLNSAISFFLWNQTYPSIGSRVHSNNRLLPCLSHTSGVKYANHNKYSRSHVLYYSRFSTPKSMLCQSQLFIVMVYSLNPSKKGINLQWQTSSTELIDASPICDHLTLLRVGALKHKITREPGKIALDLFIETLRRYAIQFGQIPIDHHFLAS